MAIRFSLSELEINCHETDLTRLRDESSQRDASSVVRISAFLGEHNIKPSFIGSSALIRDCNSNAIRVDS